MSRNVIAALPGLLVPAAGCRPGTPMGVAAETPDHVRAAHDAVLAYLSEHYGEQAPATDLTWAETRPLREVPGWGEYRFTAEGWVITIGYVVLPAEWTFCDVTVANRVAGFQWEGEVDAAGQVTELSASTEPTTDVRDPGRALHIALAYLSEHYGEQAPATGLTWVGDRPPPEEPVGAETFEFTSE